MQTKKSEIWVGVFLLVALLAALFVCLKAANVTFVEVDKKPFIEATAPVREKYGAPFADLVKRVQAVE